MSDSFQRLLGLLSSSLGKGDIITTEEQPEFRINLNRETIDLWGITYDQDPFMGGDLLLACSDSEGPIEKTSLTWVVGSAIRRAHVTDPTACELLLQEIGIEPDLAAATMKYCPGIADGVVWALYLERHGHLRATPVLTRGLGREAMAGLTSFNSGQTHAGF